MRQWDRREQWDSESAECGLFDPELNWNPPAITVLIWAGTLAGEQLSDNGPWRVKAELVTFSLYNVLWTVRITHKGINGSLSPNSNYSLALRWIFDRGVRGIAWRVRGQFGNGVVNTHKIFDWHHHNMHYNIPCSSNLNYEYYECLRRSNIINSGFAS